MKTTLLSFIAVIIGFNASAQTTQLWGTCMNGGLTGQGTIFVADADGSNLHIAYNFINATGAAPLGGVTRAGNGKLYGVTKKGGYADSCVVYSYDPQSGIYTDIHDLYQYISQGYGASSEMVRAADGMLYGLCPVGGANGKGSIYKVNPNTDVFSDVHDFIAVEGATASGSLATVSDGKLYGMATYGGALNYGTIFSFDPAVNTFTTLYSFDNVNGAHPQFGNLIECSDGKLYGMTYEGGAHSKGVIFTFDKSLMTYSKLYDFNTSTGYLPFGSLLQASDGKLYGMTSTGGSTSNGIIFVINPATGVYTDLLDFDGTNGSTPTRHLTQGSNGKLFGTTSHGGSHGAGVAFSFDITTSTYTKLVDFSDLTTGSNPDCEIVELPTILETAVPSQNSKVVLSISPNPATNALTISNSNREETLDVFDIVGNQLATIQTSALSKTILNISNYPAIFFIKTQAGEVQKIIRQ